MCIATDAGRYYFVYWICLIHAVAVAGVAQSQDCGSKACGKGDAVVQQLRARQRQIEADLVHEPVSSKHSNRCSNEFLLSCEAFLVMC